MGTLASLDEGIDESELRSVASRLAILYREGHGNTPPAQLLTSLLTLPPEQNRALADYVQETKLSPVRQVVRGAIMKLVPGATNTAPVICVFYPFEFLVLHEFETHVHI